MKRILKRYEILLILAGAAIFIALLVKIADMGWKFAFLITLGLAIFVQFLKLNWLVNDNQESISALKGIYPFLTPATLKEVWDYAHKHLIFLKWIMVSLSRLEEKLKDLKEGIYNLQPQPDLDFHDTSDLFEDAFAKNSDYFAIGHQDRMLDYFVSENGETFLRNLCQYKEKGLIRSIKRFVILPEEDKNSRLQPFIEMHHRFHWEIWTIRKKLFNDIYPDTLKIRMSPEALDVGFFGNSYVCEATHSGCPKPPMKWIHNEKILKDYKGFFDALQSVASKVIPDAESHVKLSFDTVYEKFSSNHKNIRKQ